MNFVLSGRNESGKAELGTSEWRAAHSDHGRRGSEPRYSASQESCRRSSETARPSGEYVQNYDMNAVANWGN